MSFKTWVAEKVISVFLNQVIGKTLVRLVDGFWSYMTGKRVRKENREEGRMEERLDNAVRVNQDLAADARAAEGAGTLTEAEVDAELQADFRK